MPVIAPCDNCGKIVKRDRAKRRSTQRIYCDVACKLAFKRRPMDFWSFVDQSGGPDACWPWKGERFTKFGYGTFSDREGKTDRVAHRKAFELIHGKLPKEVKVRHRCDNPPCCNPAHLLAGTIADNNADMVERLRFSRVLEPEQIRAIRKDSRRVRDIANAYDITRGHVCNIKARRIWAHLTD
jgi:hypothetical protein